MGEQGCDHLHGIGANMRKALADLSFPTLQRLAAKGVLRDGQVIRPTAPDGVGYKRLIVVRDGRVISMFEHRFVMEQALGRRLGSDEFVHHLDREKTNNDLDNLKVVSATEHYKLHRYHRLMKNPLSVTMVSPRPPSGSSGRFHDPPKGGSGNARTENHVKNQKPHERS